MVEHIGTKNVTCLCLHVRDLMVMHDPNPISHMGCFFTDEPVVSRIKPHFVGDGLKRVSESTVSNTELSEFFGPHERTQ